MNLAFLGSILSCAALVGTNAFANSEFTGLVHTLNVNKDFGGAFTQVDSAPIFEAGSPCAASWAFTPIPDELTKHYVALAVAAKSTGTRVRTATSGYIATAAGQVPRIQWMDYDIRLGQ